MKYKRFDRTKNAKRSTNLKNHITFEFMLNDRPVNVEAIGGPNTWQIERANYADVDEQTDLLPDEVAQLEEKFGDDITTEFLNYEADEWQSERHEDEHAERAVDEFFADNEYLKHYGGY